MKKLLAACSLAFALGYVGSLHANTLTAEECFQHPAYQQYTQSFVETGYDQDNDDILLLPVECRELAKQALTPVADYVEYEDSYTRR